MGFTGNTPFRFQLAGRDYALTDRLYSAQGTKLSFHDALGVEQFFHQLLPDAAAVDRLRRWVATDPGRSQDLDDHRLVDDVAHQVASGALTVWRLGSASSEKAAKVMERFHERIEREMSMSAPDLLDPGIQSVEGHPALKQIPPEKMKDALVELFIDMPLGESDVGRELCEVLADTPLGRGRDLAALSPRELGAELQKEAKDWLKGKVDSLRKEQPALFWSLAAAAFVGAGALVYTQGTGVAAKLGVKPEAEQSLLDGKLKLREGVGFGPELSDPKLRLDATGRLANGQVELGAGTTLAGKDVGHIKPEEVHASATLRRDGTTASGTIGLGGDGTVQRYGVSASHTWTNVGPVDQLTASSAYQRDLVTNSETLTGGIVGKSGTLDFSLSGQHDFVSGSSKLVGDVGKKIGDSGRLSAFVEQEIGGPKGSDTRAGVLFSIRF